MIGFFFIVPVGKTRTVIITYKSPSGVDLNATAFDYSLHLYKQPGAANDPYTVSLSYPGDVAVVSSDKGLTNVGGKLIYEMPLSSDSTLTARFARK